jgi:predicted DNA-binding protein (MmcQ/YjbR family)
VTAVAAPKTGPDPIGRIRTICLGYPEATEKSFGGHTAPAFRVRQKLFLVVGESREHVTCKAPPGVQELMVGSDPRRYFVPPYVGAKGWIGVRLDGRLRWDDMIELIDESYRLVAPKRLVARLDEGAD